MRKFLVTILMLFATLFLAACAENGNVQHTAETQEASNQQATQNEMSAPDIEVPATAPELSYNLDKAYELCPDCGMHYVHELLRQPTPPMNIHEMFALWQGVDADFPQEEHEANIAKFVRDFENVYTVTYAQFETSWLGTIILWTDSPLLNFSFVSLDVAGHDWDENGQLVINTQEVLFAVPELLPTDAVVLNVTFAHYLLPHGAIIFTDEDGVQRRMFIHEDMRGGCFPSYRLGLAHELATY